MARVFGWTPDAEGVEAIIDDRTSDVFNMSPADDREIGVCAFQSSQSDPIVLFDALRPLEPNWRRGAQKIGDCVSWGYAIAADLVVAVSIWLKQSPWEWPGVFATEPIYGGSRVEARGRTKPAGYSDGSYGGAAAKWLTQWGALNRIDYSLATGNAEHNLTTYSGERAKAWGNWGCGGRHDRDKLDTVARQRPVSKAYRVTSFDQLAAAIKNGYPVAICSGQGLGKRGADGFAPPRGSWSHCMTATGLRFDKPGALITNSWGNSWGTSAPLPGVDWDEVKKCSAWVDAKTVDRMLKQNDSFALTGVDGLKRREINWREGWEINGRS